MMILAGVDEAGLGPTLGPLATASAALSVPDAWRPESPWDSLADSCRRDWRRGDARPAVGDSKLVYRSGGAAALELAVGAFSLLANARPEPAVTAMALDAPRHPCYEGALDAFPVHTAPEALAAAAAAVDRELRAASAGCVHLETALLHEPALNGRFADGLNKNQALLMETGRHLRRLTERFAAEPLVVVVDKQGGRDNYLPFLLALFPGAWVEELERGAGRSTYRLRRAGGDAVFHFQAKADRSSFATALASLAAKYARERCLAAMNAWFSARVAGLRPTAGYPEDARRWLAEVRRAPGADELRLDLLVRKK